MTELRKHVETMVKKAAEAQDSGDAMRFAQAALNTVNAMLGLSDVAKRNP